VTNPFFEPSTLPYQLPPFEHITDDDFGPAFDRGMSDHLAEIEAITADPSSPTFDNTFVPLERSGRLLQRVSVVFFNKASADTNDRIDELQATYAARLSAHQDAIRLSSPLYERVRAVHEQRDALDPEQRYLVERYFTEFTLAGAGLEEDDKETLKKLNERLATLSSSFSTALLADSNDLALVLDDASELDGLTPGEISAAASAAKDRGLDGKYVVSLVLPTAHPHLDALTNRETRRRLFEAQRARGNRGGAHDTRDIVREMVAVRAESARLLGFANHAAAVTADNTAGTPEAVMDLLQRLAPAAARNARTEQEALEKLAAPEIGQGSIEPWDWPFYAERVRTAEYDVDFAAMRPYFEAERVLQDGVFFSATRLFGITFSEREDLVGYHPDVRIFEVHEEDGTPLGLYLLDLYTRDSKRGGAWMNSLVDQSALLDSPTAIVTNNLNVPKPAAGEVTLLTYDEVNTFFHEFGHALHGLLAKVTYPKFSGTAVFRDFVEYPSQVNEMWMLWPEVAANYAVHHETGQPLPAELIDRLNSSRTFNEGYATSEYLAASLLDQAWHQLTPEEARVDDVEAFEAQALAAAGLDNPAVPSRYYTSYFAHLFASGYSAAYYSYIWSEVLDADTVEWFKANGGLTRENGDEYRRYVVGIGGTKDPLESYREWRGRDAVIEPLLKRRGLE
jgi:peptidyl-dipeptidase Dcp